MKVGNVAAGKELWAVVRDQLNEEFVQTAAHDMHESIMLLHMSHSNKSGVDAYSQSNQSFGRFVSQPCFPICFLMDCLLLWQVRFTTLLSDLLSYGLLIVAYLLPKGELIHDVKMQSEHSHQMPCENFEPAAAWTRPRTYPAVAAVAAVAAAKRSPYVHHSFDVTQAVAAAKESETGRNLSPAEVEALPQASAAIRTGIQWDVHAPTGTRIQKSPLSLFAAAANSITLSVGGGEGGKVGNVVGGRETGKYGGIGLQRAGRLLPEAQIACQAPASTTPSIASQDSDTPMHRRAPDLFLM
jgi:hypothetical protein